MKYIHDTEINFKGRVRYSDGGKRWAAAVLLAVFTLSAWMGATHALTKMQLAYTWGPISFVFNSDSQRKQLEANGTYKQGNQVPFDVDVDPRSGRVFIALPWMMAGAGATLATVENKEQRFAPRLVPYPDWSWHAGARGCDGLTSVFRIQVERCGRLWVIDSGVADITNTFERRCPPQLLVFSLSSNKLLARHRFTTPQATCAEALLLAVSVEQVGANCDNDAYAYVADAGGYALFVYSLRQNKSWRVASNLFYPDVNARVFEVAGTSLSLMDGILGLGLSPRVDARCGRHLFFHALSSFQEGRVCTALLRNATLFQDGGNAVADAFQFIGRREGQASDQYSSDNGVLFFSVINKYSINCWNQRKKYGGPNHPPVEKDRELIRFVTGLKIVPSINSGNAAQVWAISNNAQLVFTGKFQPNVNNTVNVLRGDMKTLLAGVNC